MKIFVSETARERERLARLTWTKIEGQRAWQAETIASYLTVRQWGENEYSVYVSGQLFASYETITLAKEAAQYLSNFVANEVLADRANERQTPLIK